MTAKPTRPQSTELNQRFVEWFRHSSPYVRTHRGKTFVISIKSVQLTSANFDNHLQDLALLSSLGIRLVIVHGTRTQIDNTTTDAAGAPFAHGVRITDAHAIEQAKAACGIARANIEAGLSRGIINSPAARTTIRIGSGNFITAKPIGVQNGVDYQLTGSIRRIDKAGILSRLDAGDVVLISPLGYSPTGEVFNLVADDLALALAIELSADKLVMFLDEVYSISPEKRNSVFSPAEADRLSEVLKHNPTDRRRLHNALIASEHRIARVHLIPEPVDGSILLELFTREGLGMLITSQSYETIRQADINDLPGILSIIAPLEAEGTLIRRPRERIELSIDDYYVIESESMIIAVAALHPLGAAHSAELACLAVHRDYRRSSHGERLLKHVEAVARNNGIDQLFVLTTTGSHWFTEHGFVEIAVHRLPQEKLNHYDEKRNSKALIKSLC